MGAPFDASIVPITLSINGRTGLTLWAPPWEDEDGEQWQGFLGDGAKILLFPGPRELADFVASGQENDLSDHPAWGRVLQLTPEEFRPAQDDRLDLDEVYELAAGEPDPVHVSRLANIVDMVGRIADCCDDGALRRLVVNTPAYADLIDDEVSYTGREGRKRWTELGDTIADSWERALGRVETWLDWRGEFAVDESEDEPGEPGDGSPAGPADRTAGRGTRTSADELDADPWERIGAEPIRIVLPHRSWLTLRAELDGEVLFLGADATVAVFTEATDLARYARLGGEHELTRLPWWEQAADLDDEDFEPAPDASYDLRKPSARGAGLLRDLATFCRLEEDLDAADWADLTDPEEPLDRRVFTELRDEIVTCLQPQD